MTPQEKALARRLFELKIHTSDGNEFEKLFSEILSYSDDSFRQIKPWGNIGDRKNDGYNPNTGVYYQVYAPEDIRNSYPEVIKKAFRDFYGLQEQWTPINAYYFVVNDKFKGVNADSEQLLQELVAKENLLNGGFLTARNLEKILFDLDDDVIYNVTGYLPDMDKITNLDYSVLNQVISFVMDSSCVPPSSDIFIPDWNKKIVFNNLSSRTKMYLDVGIQSIGSLDTYLANNTFLADELQRKLTGIYEDVKQNIDHLEISSDEKFKGDFIFWELIRSCSPESKQIYQAAVIVLLAKYFETCDIFEKPEY